MLPLGAFSFDVSVHVVPFTLRGLFLQLGVIAVIGLIVWLVLRKKPGPR